MEERNGKEGGVGSRTICSKMHSEEEGEGERMDGREGGRGLVQSFKCAALSLSLLL